MAGLAGAVVVLLAGAGAFWKWKQPAPQEAPRPEPVVTAPAPPRKVAKKKDPGKADAAAQKKDAHVATVDILIKSNVKDASITVDGHTQPGWLTPHSVPLSPGAHSIEVAKAGYRPKKLAMTFAATGARELSLNLAPLTVAVEIITTPAGAEVVVDGQSQQARTPSTYQFSLGEHHIEVRKEGFHTAGKTVAVGAQSPSRVELTLEASKPALASGASGSLRVLTRPPRASISVDGQNTRYQSPVNFQVPAGRHTIKLEHRGFAPITREVTITPGQIFHLEVDLLTGLSPR